ncbi:hypothetical protein F4815DRAFT_497806 [Daldinia loculata]|nr:hypothetical protein F4815DRAFT_497806 [Daldinia loculata]
MRVDFQDELDEVMSLDDHIDLGQQTDIDLQIHTDLKPKTATAPSSFPKFNSLPQYIRRMIWKLAMDEESGARYVALDSRLSICRPVPALAHVCRMSRSVAFEKGGVFELGDGSITWFRPDTDFVYWDSVKFNLGELTSSVQNLIMPLVENCSSGQLFDRLSETFEELFVSDDPSRLENIFISVEWTTASNIWSEMAISQLFGSSRIVAPALDQFDPLIDHVDGTSLVLPGTIDNMWKQYRAIPFDTSVAWRTYAGEVLRAWIHTAAWFSDLIGEDQFEDFENERLMHPDGGSWWDWFADRAPSIFPTLVFARMDGDEIIMTFA